jgi:alpha-glucosidase
LTQQIVQYSDEAPVDPLTIEIYPAPTSSTVLYEDDGISFDYRQGKYCLRTLSFESSDQRYDFTISNPDGSYRPPKRSIVVKLNDATSEPLAVTVDGAKLSQVPSDRLDKSRSGWAYDAKAKIVRIKLNDTFKEQRLHIE